MSGLRKSGLLFILLLASVALQIGCACTKPECGFGITAPTDGATLPQGDVEVRLSPRGGNFCNFAAHGYDVRLDNGQPMRVASSADLMTRFPNVGAGEHTVRAEALDSFDRVVATATVRFRIEAPPPPPPAPTPAPAPEVAPPASETPDEMNRKGYLKDVFFDFDRYEIRQDQRDPLSANAEWLSRHAEVQVTIEGHCDERGTRGYNLALGERRANAAKDYLVRSGVDASRITTISYGKDRPFDSGHDETAWAKNRRAHFVVTGK
ncbi:MAG: peptidoglycan-associated lipoprotein Pal [Thermoanaerobaculia bacterium]